MHTAQCHRLTAAVTDALAEDTSVLVLRGTESLFSNGIHLGVIDAAPDPAAEAWANIAAIDDLCTAIASAEQITATDVVAVDGEDRLRELARMLSGQEESVTALRHAAELIERAGVQR